MRQWGRARRRHPRPAGPAGAAGAGRRADRGGSAVLVAPPGTGKTTLVPLGRRRGVARPGRRRRAPPDRRPRGRAADGRAARRAGRRRGRVRRARRAAAGPRPGSRWSPPACWCGGCSATRSCAGVGAVMLDECHERHLDTDLALAFLRRRARARCAPTCGCSPRRPPPTRRGSPRCSAARRSVRGRAARCTRSTGVVPAAAPGRARRTACGSTPRCSTTSPRRVRRALARARRGRAGVPARARARSRRSPPAGRPAAASTCCRCTAGCPAPAQDAALRAGPPAAGRAGRPRSPRAA